MLYWTLSKPDPAEASEIAEETYLKLTEEPRFRTILFYRVLINHNMHTISKIKICTTRTQPSLNRSEECAQMTATKTPSLVFLCGR